MLLVFIGKKPEGKVICSYSPKSFLNKVFREIFGYETDKNIEEVIEILNRVKRREDFVVPFSCTSKNIVKVLLRIKNKNLKFYIYLSKDEILKLKKYKDLLRNSKIFLEDREISFKEIERTYNIFPISVTSFITVFYVRFLLYSMKIGALQIAITVTIFFLIILRIIIYWFPRE